MKNFKRPLEITERDWTKPLKKKKGIRKKTTRKSRSVEAKYKEIRCSSRLLHSSLVQVSGHLCEIL